MWEIKIGPVRSGSGKDPVERIRRILAVCPDETHHPIPTFTFILERHCPRNVHRTFERPGSISGQTNGRAQPYLQTTAVEALLFWALKRRTDVRHQSGWISNI